MAGRVASYSEAQAESIGEMWTSWIQENEPNVSKFVQWLASKGKTTDGNDGQGTKGSEFSSAQVASILDSLGIERPRRSRKASKTKEPKTTKGTLDLFSYLAPFAPKVESAPPKTSETSERMRFSAELDSESRKVSADRDQLSALLQGAEAYLDHLGKLTELNSQGFHEVDLLRAAMRDPSKLNPTDQKAGTSPTKKTTGKKSPTKKTSRKTS